MSSFQLELDKARIGFNKQTGIDIAKYLTENRYTISVVEVFTGGALSQHFSRLPGSHHFFLGGIISYHPLTMIKLCRLKPETLRNNGLVSKAVALELAKGVQQATSSTISIATVGPIQQTPKTQDLDQQKAITGKTIIGLMIKNETYANQYPFSGGKEGIQHQIATIAISFLKQKLKLFETEEENNE